MTAVVKPNATKLERIAAEINEAHAKCERALWDSVQGAIRAGELLEEAKAGIEHGDWGAWVAEHCQFSLRTAQGYMRVARELPAKLKGGKYATVAHLSLRESLKLLSAGGRDGTTGTGWLVGEPWVMPRDAAELLELRHAIERGLLANGAVRLTEHITLKPTDAEFDDGCPVEEWRATLGLILAMYPESRERR